MKHLSFRDLVRKSVGLPVGVIPSGMVEDSMTEDALVEWAHKSNQAYIQAKDDVCNSDDFGNDYKIRCIRSKFSVPDEAIVTYGGIDLNQLSYSQLDEAYWYAVGITGSSYYDWTGSSPFDPSVEFHPYEHKEINWIEHRCSWCGRKYFEHDAVCSGCGAPI